MSMLHLKEVAELRAALEEAVGLLREVHLSKEDPDAGILYDHLYTTGDELGLDRGARRLPRQARGRRVTSAIKITTPLQALQITQRLAEPAVEFVARAQVAETRGYFNRYVEDTVGEVG